jgi:hypothetical protein
MLLRTIGVKYRIKAKSSLYDTTKAERAGNPALSTLLTDNTFRFYPKNQ